MFAKVVTTTALSLSLAAGATSMSVAAPSNASHPSTTAVAQIAQEDQGSVSVARWNADIAKLIARGNLRQVSVQKTASGVVTSYEVLASNTHKVLGGFSVTAPLGKALPAISAGMLHWWEPAVIFNQNDQRALNAGGMAAVTAMAAAWAAALSETVVGSIISAGVIAGIGGTAAYYVSQHGICSGGRNLWVGVTNRDVACK